MILARSAFFVAALLVGAVAPASAQISTLPVQYQLADDSYFIWGCFPPCFCPIFLNMSLEGTFVLQYQSTDAAGFDHYDVLNVDWLFTSTFPPDHVTGTGHYMRDGIQEQLVLDLVVNGQLPATHYDSGPVIPTLAFPAIDISVAQNFFFCQDQAYRVIASIGTAATPFCSGDGTATACPCGNAGAPGYGCGNSVNATGALLWAHGSASIGNDTAVLESSGTADTAQLFFQGTTQFQGGAGAVFGDGLRCVGGAIRRLRTVQASGGQAHIPGAGDPPLSVIGAIGAPATVDYQVWYRNAAPFCTPSTFNLTNGLEIVWSP